MLKNLRMAESLIRELSQVSKDFKSERLRSLVTYISAVKEDEGCFLPVKKSEIYLSDSDSEFQESIQVRGGGLLPHSGDIILQIEGLIRWEGEDQEIAVPAPGILAEYDLIKDEVKECEGELKTYLTGIRKRMGDYTIEFSQAKYRYKLFFSYN